MNHTHDPINPGQYLALLHEWDGEDKPEQAVWKVVKYEDNTWHSTYEYIEIFRWLHLPKPNHSP